VRLVKCLTNELFVPEDADIVIEGYVDTGEDMIWEGPFGDHTGFYSLADWYPRFHVTCISHRKDAIYPATIVGVPPQEDSWFARATERLFLAPVRMALLPEVIDFHMPDAGVAHNLVIVKISKTYPGQGMKVLSSLFGAGQMMFSKYIIVVSGDVDIRDYGKLFRHISVNTSVKSDLVFGKGPLDVLDHASDTFSFGGKLGIDATVKLPEEGGARQADQEVTGQDNEYMKLLSSLHSVKAVSIVPGESFSKLAVIAVDPLSPGWKDEMTGLFKAHNQLKQIRMLIAVGHPADPADYFTVAWQLLGNSDPARDHSFLAGESILIDGTIKAYRQGGFPRRWPNVVCSSEDTIRAVDEKWESLELGGFIESPSLKTRKLLHGGNEEVVI
jgi:4-hydroxy-3-polyprenylbenzoate decarboxylase